MTIQAIEMYKQLIEIHKEQYEFNLGPGGYKPINIDPEIIKILIENNCWFLDSGCYSICFENGEEVFSIVDDDWDLGKWVLADCKPNKHLPPTECLHSVYNGYSLYKMPKYDLGGGDRTTITELNNLDCYSTVQELNEDLKDLALSYSIKKALMMFMWEAEQYNAEVNFDRIEGNVGWLDNQPVFFDIATVWR